MVLDIAGIFLYLFSFLPSPIAELVFGLFAVCVLLLVIRFVALVLDAIPFI